MFISIHIPKTAGTALAYLFDHGSGRRIFYDYKDDYSNARMDDLAWWQSHRAFLERQFDFIHGHFFYEKYAELFPDAFYITCLRHPVDRIISHYSHVYFERNPDDWQYQAIRDGRLDIVEFAKLDGVRDAQARHLEGREIEDYEFVFISEWLDTTFRAFQIEYGFGRHDPLMPGTEADGAIPRMNVRPEKVPVTQAMREAIYDAAPEDVDIYVRGCEYATTLLRRSGVA
jgi:hypothetical protein